MSDPSAHPTDAAEEPWRRVLAAQPENLEALRSLARIAGTRGDFGGAVALLSRAAKAAPQDVGVLAELGIAYRAAERYDAARYVLERALLLDAGRNPFLRLLLAQVLERDARPELALLHYFRALVEARRAQRWAQPGVPTFAAERLIAHAEHYAATGRRAWFERALAPLREQAPHARWDRVEAALAAHLGERTPTPVDPRQHAGMLFMPGLSTAPFPDPTHLPWLPAAAVALAGVREEIAACLEAALPAGGSGRVPICLRGIEQYEARRHARRLLARLAELPLARVSNHAPDVEIVALAGQVRLPAQYGRSNARCWAVFALGENTAVEVTVGGETRPLVAGETRIVDPSFGVAWHNAGASRATLLTAEVWHPGLAEHERQALSVLFAAAVDFDTRLQELP